MFSLSVFVLFRKKICIFTVVFSQDVLRFDQQINYASSAAFTGLTFSDHFAVSWAGATSSCRAVAELKPCQVSSSSPCRDGTPCRWALYMVLDMVLRYDIQIKTSDQLMKHLVIKLIH